MLATKKLDGGSAVLPSLSPLIERRKLEPSVFEPAAESLERAGFNVGWNEGSLQVGGSPAQSGLCTPTGYDSMRSGYRPRTSGFLSFNKNNRDHPNSRPRTSASFTAPSPSGLARVVPPPPLSPQHGGAYVNRFHERTPSERFSRLATSLDSANVASLHANASASGSAGCGAGINGSSAQPVTAGGGGGGGGTGQFTVSSTEANVHASNSQSITLPPPSRGGSMANGLLPSSSQVAAHMRVNIPLSNLRDSERPGTGMPGTYSRTSGGTVIQVPLGVPSPSSPQAKAQAFKASRGQALMVFNEMDSDKNGKVTRSELEAAALSLGFSLDQAHRLWDRLDRRGRGFLDAQDWGYLDAFNQVQLLSTRYLQKYMGVPDISSTPENLRKYQRAQELMEVKSLAAAVNKVRANAISRGMQAAGATGNPIYDTFRFMDTDNSGELTKEEIRDAFFALGVFLAEPVVNQIMQVFDKDGSGAVQYHEFQRTMFPGASRG